MAMAFEDNLIKTFAKDKEFMSSLKVAYKKEKSLSLDRVFENLNKIGLYSINDFLDLCNNIDSYSFVLLLDKLEKDNRVFFGELSFYILKSQREERVKKFNERIISLYRAYKASNIFGNENINNFKIKVN